MSDARQTRLFFLGTFVLALAGAAGSSAGYFLISGRKDQYIESRLSNLGMVAAVEADSISDFHRERLSDLQFYFGDLHLAGEYRRVLAGNEASRRDVERVFKALVAKGLYAGVFLVDAQGRAVLRVPADAPVPSPSGRPAGRPSLVRASRTERGLSLDYEAPAGDGARLVFRTNPVPWMSSAMRRWPTSDATAELLLLERRGGALKALNAPRKPEGPAPRPASWLDGLAAQALRGEPGPLLASDYRGDLCYFVWRPVAGLDWLVVAKIDERELLSPMREKLHLHLLAAAGISALLAAFILVLWRSAADQARAKSDEDRRLLSTAIEQTGESVVVTDKDARILYTNPAFTRVTGYSREEARGKNPSILKSGRLDEAFYKSMWSVLARGEAWNGRFENRRKDGTVFEEDASITPVRGADGSVTHYIAVKRDVSAVKSLEDQLFHSQKMEAIGRLAGGIAHDFNNILTTINGYTEMLIDSAAPQSQTASDLAEILGAGRRAALLTRQLLTFSRRAPSDPVVIDLRLQVRAIEKILRRTLGEDVKLRLDLPEGPLWIRTDPGQIDQVLMNLAVNARDAMPRGGALTVRAAAEHLAADETRGIEVIPAGRYVVLVVSDEGEGMDSVVLSRLFEPFFTTKEKGKGTGLGLATVFGIVKQNKGHITVDSERGKGSTFKLYFPLTAEPAAAPAAAEAAPAGPVRGDETVLLVEDQAEVLRLVSMALTSQGYRVLSCGGGKEALVAARELHGPLHLLLTDVVMPGMGGVELAGEIGKLRPEARVLYMSGYTDGRLDSLVESGQKTDLVLKPFTAEQIARRVRDALDGAPPKVA